MRALGYFVLLTITMHVTTGQRQAPGDEDQLCIDNLLRPPIVNQDVLMASFDYVDLIQTTNAPWAVVDLDGNNEPSTNGPFPMVRN